MATDWLVCQKASPSPGFYSRSSGIRPHVCIREVEPLACVLVVVVKLFVKKQFFLRLSACHSAPLPSSLSSPLPVWSFSCFSTFPPPIPPFPLRLCLSLWVRLLANTTYPCRVSASPAKQELRQGLGPGLGCAHAHLAHQTHKWSWGREQGAKERYGTAHWVCTASGQK